ncbi:MAG: hypothetical protein HOP17_12350 [Acidobacteria bacterium]|nr:hypothetical protein [Acidobacteriota bacterium]
MERRSTDSRLHTIRAKIWMMVILLAVVNCVSGAIVFFAASMLTSETWIPVVITIAVSTITTIAFAWWISSDVLRPLDKLNLLASSIERSPGMSVPKTTGAVETDDILHTISRASKQLTNVIDLMDDVSSGNTQAVLDPLENPDRLSESFRKLVAKVTDSIDAKADLARLQLAINQINYEISGLQRGENVRVKNDYEGIRPITDALRFLLERNAEMSMIVSSNTSELKTLVTDGKSRLSTVVEKDAARERTFKKLVTALGESQTETERSMQDMSASLAIINEALAEIKKNPISHDENAKAQSAVKKQFDAAIHKLRDVGEQSLAITHVAKSVQDLARRSNMIALNTSIQANGEYTGGLSTLTQEITSLSERAEKANKAIAGISDSVVRDINEANASIQWVSAEVAKIVARTVKSEELIDTVSGTLSQLTDLPAKLEVEAAERSAKSERNVQIMEDCGSRGEDVSAELKTCEMNLSMMHDPLELIRESVTGRKHVLTPLVADDGAGAKKNGSGNNGAGKRDLITIAGEK